LEASGYHVCSVERGSEVKAAIEAVQPDLILLDLMLPDADGLVLTPALRGLSNVPVIICSSRQAQADRVLGLRLGADDFVAKPFDIDELEARIAAVLRRASRAQHSSATPTDPIQVGPLTISQARGVVTLAGQRVRLTPTEFRLLVALASRPGEVLSREKLGRLIWGYEDLGTGHLVDVHIGRLRLKLRRVYSEPLIRTVRGKGYVVGGDQPQPAEAAAPAPAAAQPARRAN
jgi:DNA-binding response OmpR family regulator